MEICYNGVWGTVCADNSWDEVDANVVCQQLGITYQRALLIIDSRFGASDGPILLENVNCSNWHSNLSQCVDFAFIGARGDCKDTAGVICMDEFMISTSTEQVQTTTVRATTTNMLYATTYTSRNSTSTASGGSGSRVSVLPIIYGTIPGVLVIIGVIAAVAIVIIVVVIVRRRVGQMDSR